MTTARHKLGFTLLEVLVAITILVIITAVVYASLSSVVTATEIARVSADEMRMRQFLTRSFQTNFTTIIADPMYEDERYVLVGISEDGSRGAMDSIEFASSAPLIGGASPPGAVKRVYYGAVSNSPGAGGGGFFGDPDQEVAVGAMKLESSEQTMLDPAFAEEYGTDFFGDGGGAPDTFGQNSFSDQRVRNSRTDSSDSKRKPMLTETETGQSPGWNVPCDQFDISYFDGYEWVEDWDSIEFGRMPWAVRIRLNYARTDDERDADRDAGIKEDEDFDFETVIAIPIGAGLIPEEEKLDNQTTRPGNRNNLFDRSNRDRNRRKDNDDDRDKDEKPRRNNRNNNSSSGFGGSRSNSRGGSFF